MRGSAAPATSWCAICNRGYVLFVCFFTLRVESLERMTLTTRSAAPYETASVTDISRFKSGLTSGEIERAFQALDSLSEKFQRELSALTFRAVWSRDEGVSKKGAQDRGFARCLRRHRR